MRHETRILIDIDGSTKFRSDEIKRRLAIAGLRSVRIRSKISPSGKGVHVACTVAGIKLSRFAIVALQAICGSDSKREAQNFRRASLASKYWGDNWNVLYK